MNNFVLFLKRLLRFFDKKIITPLTKFFVWITEKVNGSSKTFEKMFSKKSSLVIVSLILSIGIFFYVDTKSTTISETSAEVLYNQKVNAIYNEEAYVIEGIPETVDITMIGRKSDLYLAKQLPIDAVDIDLKDLKPGTHKVTLKYSGSIDTISYKIDPSVATVVVYSKMSEVRTLSYDIINQDKLDSRLSISSVELDRQEVIIKGPQYKLDKVANVKALVDINNIAKPEVGEITLENVKLVAYDEMGNIIDIEIVPNKVNAKITITSPSKVVPVNVIPVGNLAFGKAISNISSSVNSVTIYGDEATLSNIKSIDVEIDVDGLDSTKKYPTTIKKPNGVRYISETYTNITVDVGTETVKEIENVQLVYENLSDNYSINAASNEDKYATVILRGVESVLDEITEDDIKVYVDLKGYGPGTHDIDVIVSGDDVRVSYEAKVKKVTLIISHNITKVENLNNSAEIYEAYNEQGLADIDSTPGNKVETEDDMSKADVILSLVTGGTTIMIITLVLGVTVLLAFGVYEIKRRVLKKK